MFFIFMGIVSCHSEKRQKVPKKHLIKTKEEVEEINKIDTEIESNQIDAYVKRKKLEVKKTKTGLRYYIEKKGTGKNAEPFQIVRIKYKLYLLNGKLCYETKEDEVEEFKVEMGYVESGLHEAMTYFNKGTKATIIIPSHLAHGLVGDYDKIPFRSTIIYKVELIDIR